MKQTNRQEADALNTYVKMMRANEKITAATHRHLADHNLTSSQFAVLEALYHLGPLCQREIGKKLFKSHGNITTVINNLEKRNFVKRKRIREDRRYFSVEISPEGSALVETIFPQHVAGIVRSLSPLTTAEQHELARLCQKLGLS